MAQFILIEKVESDGALEEAIARARQSAKTGLNFSHFTDDEVQPVTAFGERGVEILYSAADAHRNAEYYAGVLRQVAVEVPDHLGDPCSPKFLAENNLPAIHQKFVL